MQPILLSMTFLGLFIQQAYCESNFPTEAKRIVFLGDSITHAGGYVAWIETQFRLNGIKPLPEIINLGLPSETCTGLSEPDHPFPRPDVHERLDRALEKTEPDVVVACYGMNDGIYYPFSQDRFKKYQQGINRLIDRVNKTNAKLILLTPPPFDPNPLRPKGKLLPIGSEKFAWFAIYENYDTEVIQPYGKWILKQKDRVDMVVDIHTPIAKYSAAQRAKDAKFTLAPDGVHPTALGQEILGRTLAKAWGLENKTPSAELKKQIEQKTRMLHDAWLSHVGHKRPGVKAGLPLAEAKRKAHELDSKIESLIKQTQ